MKIWVNELIRLVKQIITDVKALISFILGTKKEVEEAIDKKAEDLK